MQKRISLQNWDLVFILWFLTDSWFNHTIIGMCGQVIFILFSYLYCLRNKSFHFSSFFKIYAFFCCTCYANIFLGHSISPSRSMFILWVLIRNFIFFFGLYQYILHSNTKKFLEVFLTACCIASFGILLINFSRTGMLYMHDDDTLGDVINANVQSVIDGFLVSWLIISKKVRGKYLGIIFFLLFFIILSGTKKSIITIGLMISLYVLFKNPSHLVRNLFVVVCIFVFSYLIMMNIPVIYDMIGNRFESLFAMLAGESSDSSTNTRDRFIEMGLLYWAGSPIWGNGLDSFGVLWGDDTTYSHNNYVELLCSVGLVGCLTYYFLYVIPFFKSIRIYVKMHKPKALFALCILLSCLVTDYALVSYYERVTYIELLLIYVLLEESVSNNTPQQAFKQVSSENSK